MRHQLNNCKDRSICNWKELTTNDMDFVDKEYIKANCNPQCIQIATCYRILELLSQKKPDDAIDLLRNEDAND